jgi:hypothetical protein
MPPPETGPHEFWHSWSVVQVVHAPPSPLLVPPELDPLDDPELEPLTPPELLPELELVMPPPELEPLPLPELLPELEPLLLPDELSSPPSMKLLKLPLESPDPHAATHANANPRALSAASFIQVLPGRSSSLRGPPRPPNQ